MNEDWHARWEENRIGFHLTEINPHIEQFWPGLKLTPGSRVFVPLCGKTLDMWWLAEQGHEVIGVEISPIAVQAFFAENGVAPKSSRRGAFEVWTHNGITLLCGDFFNLTKELLGDIAAVYDRASLIAFPEAMRPSYVQHLAKICPPDISAIPHILVTLDYPQQQMQGPPFAVGTEEVYSLYNGHFHIEPLLSKDILEEHARFRDKGLTRLTENVTLLTPK